MASLRKKDRCQFWYACFKLPDGSRTQRSTHETQRKAAQAKADQWEKLANERVKARQAQRVIADIYKLAHQEELPQATVESYVRSWLERRKGEIAPASFAAYKGRGEDFVKWLGPAAKRPIAELETRTFVGYRDHLATRVSASTANNGIKILRVILEDARRDGLLPDNPAKDCGALRKNTEHRVRRPFTVDEIRRVLEVCDSEWRSIVLFAVYTGQRLGDLARLTWANIDPTSGEIHLRTAKTGRPVRIPICAPLQQHLSQMSAGDEPGSPVHPRLSALAATKTATLSRQFGEILAAAGLAASVTHAAAKSGRGARRDQSALTFHAFRHTAVSMMKNAGVSPAIVQDLIGHESAEISAHYTHIDHESKRRALETLPDFT